MKPHLFEEIIFGPVKSRRFGISLGINLLPVRSKFCNFNCIYCECGWTKKVNKIKGVLPSSKTIINNLIEKINLWSDQSYPIDSITFAGNGEPTLHPNFEEIVKDTLLTRDILLPDANVVVLTNSAMLHKSSVVDVLKKVDSCMFKIDAGTESMFKRINQPLGGITLQKTIDRIKSFPSPPIIQSMFVRGEIDDKIIDNTAPNEVAKWIEKIIEIKPEQVIIYTIDRPTAQPGLEKVTICELSNISHQLKSLGINASIAV
ncbi:MAG: radical SAM protein [Flavobacteriales bacterium]|nr:radical SAM protein [Flavobacteriales bacterium]